MKQSLKRKLLALLLSCVCLTLCACEATPSATSDRSISSTAINSAGELVITYSDGTSDNLGKVVGKDGVNGTNGENGTNGTNGENGKSAYELYCEKYSYDGTEEEWLDDLLNGRLTQTNNAKPELTISVLGASSSTKEGRNAVEITVGEKDVGVELSAYPTAYDVVNETTIGGYTFTRADLGKEITFTPTQDDVGKTIGNPKNYNESSVKVWWEHVEDYFNCTVNPVCWSGSSYSSFRGDTYGYETSYGWHDSQIRKLGIRVEGSMERVAPDIIILHRGINDMTKDPYARLTEGYFDDPQWKYPTTDKLADGTYGLKEALSLTIKKIRDTYPTTKIVLSSITTMQRVNYDTATTPTNNGYYSFAQLNSAIREVADFFGCPMIDFDKCGITYENGVEKGYLKSDRTHPTTKGHTLIGKQAINDLLYKAYLDVNDYLPNTETFETWQFLEGYGVSHTSGLIVENESYYTYDFIPVEANCTYYANLCRTVAVLDKNGELISYVSTTDFRNNGYKITIPTNGVYLRVCAKYTELPLANFSLTKVEN